MPVQRLRMGAMGVREKRTELRSAVNRGDGVGLVAGASNRVRRGGGPAEHRDERPGRLPPLQRHLVPLARIGVALVRPFPTTDSAVGRVPGSLIMAIPAAPGE